MTDIVGAHGGYVDKYIGDAIVAVFGAPAATARTPRSACVPRWPAASGWPS